MVPVNQIIKNKTMKELLQQLSELDIDLESCYSIRLGFKKIDLQANVTKETYDKLKSLQYKISLDLENDWLLAEKGNVSMILTFKTS
jgi:hypothetical protein